MKRCHVVNVGATPGLTRSMQEVHLDKNVKLLDCPGVVMLKSAENDASVALRNCKRIEKLDDPISPGNWFLWYHSSSFMLDYRKLYKIISSFWDNDWILTSNCMLQYSEGDSQAMPGKITGIIV